MINLGTKAYGSSLDALRAAFRALIIKGFLTCLGVEYIEAQGCDFRGLGVWGLGV